MIRPIVVPLDGSAFAEAALPLAGDVARTTQCPLHLVAVRDSPIKAVEDPNYAEEDAYLRNITERVAAESGVTATPVVLDGPVVPALAAYARSEKCRLVVMSTHGRGGMSRLLLGSVADRLIRHLPCAVLLVHPGRGPTATSAESRWRVLVPLDGTRLAESVIDELFATFVHNDVVLELVRVVPLPSQGSGILGPVATRPGAIERATLAAKEYLDGVSERLRKLGVRVITEARASESIAQAIVAYGDERRPDLVAVATHGLGGFERALLGGVADELVRCAPVPILVWHPAPGASSRILAAPVEAIPEPTPMRETDRPPVRAGGDELC